MSRIDVAWLLLWGTLSSVWCLTAARELDATMDEPFYVRAGLESWRTGSNRALMKAGTMPLPVDVQNLPIYLWEQFRSEPFDTNRDFHTILPFARVTNLLFWWLLLVYGSLLAHRFGGAWASRFAGVLLATEPSLLGHACLATTDIAATAMVLVIAYHYERGRDEKWVRRWLLPGVLFGLAMAAKVSALTFAPIIVVALEVPRWAARGAFRCPVGASRVRHFWNSTASYRADNWKIFAIGMVVAFAYCGCDWNTHPKIVKAADNLSSQNIWTPSLRWLAQTPIFPNAGEAFQFQFRHNLHGHGAYVAGEWHTRATWYYFPVALSIKLTLPVLALLALLCIVRPRALCPSLGLAAMFLLAFSLNCRVQIGIRLVFPLMVFLLLAIAAALPRLVPPPRIGGVEKKWLALLILGLVCAFPALTTWPDGLRYSNALWGGPDETHRHLSDSNADWGQGVNDLDDWTAKNNLPTATVWYYGSDPAIAGDTSRCLPLHRFGFNSLADVWPHVRGKLIAVSTTLLYGNPRISPTMQRAVEFFHGQRPIGRTRNFFVYDFRT